MNKELLIEHLNSLRAPLLDLLSGEIVDADSNSCTFKFELDGRFCHSGNVVQGGFITAMLDTAMSHSLFAVDTSITNVSSLEIKTVYYEPSLAGKFQAIGKVVKCGYKMAFLEGHLYDANGLMTASTSSVGKIVRKKD